MGLLMFREPGSPKSPPKDAIKVDPTAYARSIIRRHPLPRARSLINQRRAEIAARASLSNEGSTHSQIPGRDSQPATGDPVDPRHEFREHGRLPWHRAQQAPEQGVQPAIAARERTRHDSRSERQARFSRVGTTEARETRTREALADQIAHGNDGLRQRNILAALSTHFGDDGASQANTNTNQNVQLIRLSRSSGLGDRPRSPSSDGSTWDPSVFDTLYDTMRADERLPSASSSFVSTAALSLASLSRERSTRSSPATSIDGPAPAIGFYPPQRGPRRAAQAQPDRPVADNDDETYVSLFICDSNPTSDDDEASPADQPSREPIQTGSAPNSHSQPASAPSQHNTSNTTTSRNYTGPPLPVPRPRRQRDARERSPNGARSSSRRFRAVPTPPSQLPHISDYLSFAARASRRSHAGPDHDGPSRSHHDHDGAPRPYTSPSSHTDANGRARYLRRYQRRRDADRMLTVDELHSRYAALQRQETHLHELIRRHEREEHIPEDLWELAGVDRQSTEEAEEDDDDDDAAGQDTVQDAVDGPVERGIERVVAASRRWVPTTVR